MEDLVEMVEGKAEDTQLMSENETTSCMETLPALTGLDLMDMPTFEDNEVKFNADSESSYNALTTSIKEASDF